MKLMKYKVMNFRSVNDSGWIECENVTTLVGVNEAGKSNLILALWKLNPARNEGKIDILHDMPVSKLSEMRNRAEEVAFISAEFQVDKTSSQAISKSANCKCKENAVVIITRYYDGEYKVDFTKDKPTPNKNPQNSDSLEKDKNPKDNFDFENELKNSVLAEMPKFVYYSNYGNLSSKIYMPYAVKWLKGDKIEGIDVNDEQVRTLRVLFDFVKLNPDEILKLGEDPKLAAIEKSGNKSATPTAEQIEKSEKDKEHRSILLQSASVRLTRCFKEWWKQGEYKIRFEADGNYFRILVSDDIRPDEVGLELRSTGLQWFLSFYLVFLVESQEQHKNAILLLDEAGLTLHPSAQKFLCNFFDNLSLENQIINTTHSPFIIDTTNIDRCRVVYVDENGYTVVSSNLREGVGDRGNQSIYAVHAALGLSVSDILFQGCQPIIVEGVSDQFYLNAIKNYLIYNQKITPKQDLVFVPSGGVKGVAGVVSLLCGKTDQLPYVILDSDKNGKDAKNKLSSGLYKDSKDNLKEVFDLTKMENSEIEDIIPFSILSKGIQKLFHDVEDENFEDNYEDNKPIVPQIENYAEENGIILPDGWKVELAKSMKRALSGKKTPEIGEKYLDMWTTLFAKISIIN